MLLQKLVEQKLIQPPRWLPDNTAFLCQAGSVMYGANIGNSDIDVHGFCFAPREVTFPHLGGAIEGFGTQIQRFRVWQQHHVKTLDGNKEYDFCVYNVVDFVQLAMETNPNVLELLFAPRRCVLHSTAAFEHLRDNRHLFLMKGVMHKLRGYAFSQLNKAKYKNHETGDRAEQFKKYGYSLKPAMHTIRLCLQAEQILSEGDLDLERHSQMLLSLRRGEWTMPQIEEWFVEKEKSLETLYANSSLRHSPDEPRIKQLLLEVLEMHYGNLDTVVSKNLSMGNLINDIQTIMDRYKTLGCN